MNDDLFPDRRPPGSPIDQPEMLGELDLELAWRRKIYQSKIDKGSMTRRQADRKIEVLQKIRDQVSASYNPDSRFIRECLKWRKEIAECIDVLEGRADFSKHEYADGA